jgi:hypothetical protein
MLKKNVEVRYEKISDRQVRIVTTHPDGEFEVIAVLIPPPKPKAKKAVVKPS